VSPESTLEHLLSRAPWLVVDGDRRVADITERASRVAGGLRASGVQRGDSVAFRSRNSIDSVLVYRACWRIGARAVPLHHRFRSREVDELVNQIAPALVLTTDAEVDELGRADAVVEIAAQPDDDAVVLFTAGSTGRPKGVRHGHRGLAYKTALMVGVHDLVPSDVVLMPAPLAHISGLLNGILVPASIGMTTVLLDRWSPPIALDLIEHEHVSFMVGPPTFFVDLMDDPSFSTERVASLRLVSSGGAGVATSFVEQASRELGALVKRSYGSTEAPTVATSVASDNRHLAMSFDGHAIGQAELLVRDGELLVRGPELFAGYLSGHETGRAMTDDGWFRTGDRAHIDGDGWLTIVGRIKDIIIRAGENVSAREIEELVRAHPVVSDACVVGVPHPRLGEQIAVTVVSSSDFSVDMCGRWFEQNEVARFKTPELVMRVEQLPKLPSGKIDRLRVEQLVRLQFGIN
jgi:cyclohexanecarboxylate-CoA ligase